MTALYSVEKGLRRARIGGYLCATQQVYSAFYIEAGLSFGDGYEAIALLLFADITMNVVEHVVDLVVTDAQSVKEALGDLQVQVDAKLKDAGKDDEERVVIWKGGVNIRERPHISARVLGSKLRGKTVTGLRQGNWLALSHEAGFVVSETLDGERLVGSHQDAIRQEFHELTGHNNTVMTRLEQMSEKLVHSTWSLSTLGIQYFAFTCLLSAIPQLLACQAVSWGFNGTYKSLTSFSDVWSGTFKGMGLLGSCVAIHNMVSIEQNFEKNFLHG